MMQVFAEQPDQGAFGRDILKYAFTSVFVSKYFYLLFHVTLSKGKDLHGLKKKGKKYHLKRSET